MSMSKDQFERMGDMARNDPSRTIRGNPSMAGGPPPQGGMPPNRGNMPPNMQQNPGMGRGMPPQGQNPNQGRPQGQVGNLFGNK